MMSFNIYDQGELVTVDSAFANPATDPATALDPTTVKLSVRAPDSTVATYTYGVGTTIRKDSAGNYSADISADQSGFYYYRWFSTGTGQAAEENRFQVRAARAV